MIRSRRAIYGRDDIVKLRWTPNPACATMPGMKKQQRPRTALNRLPRTLRPFFWDYDFARLSWAADRDLIIGRILAVGNWDSLRWLRRRLPDPELRAWLVHRRGAGLSGPFHK